MSYYSNHTNAFPQNIHPSLPSEDIFVEKEIHLRDYIAILSNRRNVIYVAFSIVMISTVLFTYFKMPLYEAGARLLIEENTENPLLTTLGSFGGNTDFLTTQTEIIKSRAVGLKVVKMLNLDTTYDDYIAQYQDGFSPPRLLTIIGDWIQSTTRAGLQVIGVAKAEHIESLAASEEELRKKAEEIADLVREEISVRPTKDSRIINLTYLSPNPMLAAQIVNSVATAYIDKTFDMKMEVSDYTLKWMNVKAEEEKRKLEESERILQKYMEENDIVTIENKVAVTPQKLTEINSKLLEIQSRRKELELIHRRISRLPDTLSGAESIQAIASDTAVQALRNRILEAEKVNNDLAKTYGPKHPLMQKAKADLKVLQQQRDMEIQRVIQSIQNQYELICENEKEYEEFLNQIKRDAVNLNENLIQYNILRRDVEINKYLYKTLVTKIKEKNIFDQAQSVRVWVVEEAKMPQYPAKPDKKRNLMLGFVLAVFSGVALAFFLEYLDNTLKDPDDVEERFNLPVIGTIAMLEKEAGRQLEIEVLNNPSAAFAENFKTIRTSVMLSSSKAPLRHLLVTSMAPSEGKTTSVVNLALSIAMTGKHVLLIDADMRKPRIHKIFRLGNKKGLSNYLAGIATDRIIKKSSQPNLDIITAGPIPPNPAELLTSPRAFKLIHLAEMKYDLILFDSPPILTVSDGLNIAKLVQGTLLVARAGQTSNEMFQKGRRLLETIGAKITGVILNGSEINKNNYYYYGSYYREDNEILKS